MEQQQQQEQQQQNQQPPPPQHPQMCPRCESMNTKFCYYNNYSLSQPRHFCKACRRYWTQGGTLRNVPVGGGCRKGKRAKTSSSSAAASSSRCMPGQPHEDRPLTIGTAGAGMSTTSPSGLAAHQGYYPGGTSGYLPSFAAMQALNQSQPFNLGGHDGAGPSNMNNLLQGFSVSAAYEAISQPQQQQLQLHQLYPPPALYPSDQDSLLIQSTRAAAGDHHDWPPQSFINRPSAVNASSSSSSASALWATTSSDHMNTDTTTTTSTSAGPSLNTNMQWSSDLPEAPYAPN